MSDINGTTTTENRIGEAEAKAKKGKKAPKSKFQEGFEFLRDATSGKGGLTLTRKTEEGTLSLSLKTFPQGQTVEDVQAAAVEVGLAAAAKSSVGEADANWQRKLKTEEAEAWVEIVCN